VEPPPKVDEDGNQSMEFQAKGAKSFTANQFFYVKIHSLLNKQPTGFINPQKYIRASITHSQGSILFPFYQDNAHVDKTFYIGFYVEQEGKISLDVSLYEKHLLHVDFTAQPFGSIDKRWTMKYEPPVVSKSWQIVIENHSENPKAPTDRLNCVRRGDLENLTLAENPNGWTLTALPAVSCLVGLHITINGNQIAEGVLQACIAKTPNPQLAPILTKTQMETRIDVLTEQLKKIVPALQQLQKMIGELPSTFTCYFCKQEFPLEQSKKILSKPICQNCVSQMKTRLQSSEAK